MQSSDTEAGGRFLQFLEKVKKSFVFFLATLFEFLAPVNNYLFLDGPGIAFFVLNGTFHDAGFIFKIWALLYFGSIFFSEINRSSGKLGEK